MKKVPTRLLVAVIVALAWSQGAALAQSRTAVPQPYQKPPGPPPMGIGGREDCSTYSDPNQRQACECRNCKVDAQAKYTSCMKNCLWVFLFPAAYHHCVMDCKSALDQDILLCSGEGSCNDL